MPRKVMYKLKCSIMFPHITFNDAEITKRTKKRAYLEHDIRAYVHIDQLDVVREGYLHDSLVVYYENKDDTHRLKEQLREQMLKLINDKLDPLLKAKTKLEKGIMGGAGC